MSSAIEKLAMTVWFIGVSPRKGYKRGLGMLCRGHQLIVMHRKALALGGPSSRIQ